jgi:hypothetical protein
LMPIETMPIYRQLFDFLCLASIAIRMRRARARQTLAWEDLPVRAA